MGIRQNEAFSFGRNSQADTWGVMLPARGGGIWEIGEDETNMQKEAVKSRDQ